MFSNQIERINFKIGSEARIIFDDLERVYKSKQSYEKTLNCFTDNVKKIKLFFKQSIINIICLI
jgi:SUMO ligase MMS21 Smc5/6 complex component